MQRGYVCRHPFNESVVRRTIVFSRARYEQTTETTGASNVRAGMDGGEHC
jgi:hypothetical protein